MLFLHAKRVLFFFTRARIRKDYILLIIKRLVKNRTEVFYFINHNVNYKFYRALVSAMPCFGIRYAVLRYPLCRASVSAMPCFGIRYAVLWYPLCRASVSAMPCFGIRCAVLWYPLCRALVSAMPCFGIRYAVL